MKRLFIINMALIFGCYLLSTCKPIEYGTRYLSLTNQVYSEKYPCEIKFVIKEEWDAKKYIHIGTCISKLTPTYKLNAVENEAFKAVEKCACQKGGDIVKIVHQNETMYTVYSYAGAIKSSYIGHDDIVGEVYIILE